MVKTFEIEKLIQKATKKVTPFVERIEKEALEAQHPAEQELWRITFYTRLLLQIERKSGQLVARTAALAFLMAGANKTAMKIIMETILGYYKK